MKKLNWKKIKAIALDFDGVMTDNKVLVSEDGKESVFCNRADGWGINLLKKAGYIVACISTEKNSVVSARCKKLKIPFWHGQKNKISCLRFFCNKYNLKPDEIVFIGNDTNDEECLKIAGIAIAPSDANVKIRSSVNYITKAKGGNGVLREIADLIILNRK